MIEADISSFPHACSLLFYGGTVCLFWYQYSLNRLGNWHLNSDQPGEASRYHQEALAIFEGVNEKRGLAETLDLLGLASYTCGDLQQSSTYYQQAVALLRELDLRSELVSSLPILMLCICTCPGASIHKIADLHHMLVLPLGTLLR